MDNSNEAELSLASPGVIVCCDMRVDLKLGPAYDGFLFLAESARNPPSLRSHRHNELELNIVARGHVTYVTSAGRFTFGPRTLLWLFPAQEHQLVDRSDDAQNYVAVFKPGMIQRACRSAKYRELLRKTVEGDRVVHTVLDPAGFDFLCHLMERMMRGSLDPDILNRESGYGAGSDFHYEHGDPDALNAGLHHLLLLCWGLQSEGVPGRRGVELHPSISKALRLLADDAWTGSLESLAGECGLSGAHFSRLFASQVGVPVSRYRNSLRLGRFWEQMRKPVRPTLMEAVLAAGFGSYAQFYKVFSNAYGAGPREVLLTPQSGESLTMPKAVTSSRLPAK